jgi:hypothetical protein
MTTKGTLQVEQESVVIVYDAKTGDIVHRHDVVTFAGGKHPDESTRAADAAAELKQGQPGFSRATAVLHSETSAFKPNTLYRVDVQKRTLVEHPVQKRPARTATA